MTWHNFCFFGNALCVCRNISNIEWHERNTKHKSISYLSTVDTNGRTHTNTHRSTQHPPSTTPPGLCNSGPHTQAQRRPRTIVLWKLMAWKCSNIVENVRSRFLSINKSVPMPVPYIHSTLDMRICIFETVIWGIENVKMKAICHWPLAIGHRDSRKKTFIHWVCAVCVCGTENI